ncbi:PilW family protein [Guyparkeria hydrothermalis]|uniref:PilW family protein n=1 Tax=Guyparkeria hydrothermalis TaxID=923 RepID=UPI0020220E01|nr:PilW family protein [Guyparkeria hydrothermalis]MCL7751030.1 PilW family protein [Guyparkeria hydrothermalis]
MTLFREFRCGRSARSGACQGGFTLVELMIALVLGLLVVAGVGSVFIANKDAYRTNEALSQVQDASRTAFEFLARDVREAGSNACGTVRVESVLESGGDELLYDLTPLEGWDDASDVDDLPASGNGQPVAGESALRLSGTRDAGIRLEAQSSPRANIRLANDALGRIANGDVLMMCDSNKATIFQVINFNGTNPVVVNQGSGETPGNRTKCLDHPVPQSPPDCTNFSASAYLVVPTNYIWYVGTNADGVRGLYRYGRAEEATSSPTEMVRGVEGMQIVYHRRDQNAFETATQVDAVANGWEQVDAVRITLTVRSRGLNPNDPNFGTSTDRERLLRDFSTTIAIRNRLDG